jgi:hypothetical protein
MIHAYGSLSERIQAGAQVGPYNNWGTWGWALWALSSPERNILSGPGGMLVALDDIEQQLNTKGNRDVPGALVAGTWAISEQWDNEGWEEEGQPSRSFAFQYGSGLFQAIFKTRLHGERSVYVLGDEDFSRLAFGIHVAPFFGLHCAYLRGVEAQNTEPITKDLTDLLRNPLENPSPGVGEHLGAMFRML